MPTATELSSELSTEPSTESSTDSSTESAAESCFKTCAEPLAEPLSAPPAAPFAPLNEGTETLRQPGARARPQEPTRIGSALASKRPGGCSAFEERLIARVLEGDAEAAEALVRQFGGAMLAVTGRILRSGDDAEDALQDAFVQVFQKLGSFRRGCRLSTWLHRVAVNAALLKLRSRKRRREVPLEALSSRFDGDGAQVQLEDRRSFDPGLQMDTAERRRIVHRQLERLPGRQREIIILRDLEGLDTEETARILGITVTAAKVRLHRARQALLALLQPLGLFEDE